MIEKKQRGGWITKPFEEKKVMVYTHVKRKYHTEAMRAVRELCKQWR